MHTHADNVDLVGSDEATTCCLLFLETDSSLAVAHLDNAIRLDSLKRLVHELLNSCDPPNDPQSSRQNNLTEHTQIRCRLVGSYNDEEQCSSKFLYKFLIYLNNIPNVTVHLQLACVLDMNTKIIYKNANQYNCPIFYGAAIDLKSNQAGGDSHFNELFPAEFKDRGPEIILRRARRTCQTKDLVQVYNSATKLFIINEFRYFRINHIDLLVNASDQYILDNFSTSPHVEPEHFAESIRQVFALMKNNKAQEPTHRFKREPDGNWLDEFL